MTPLTSKKYYYLVTSLPDLHFGQSYTYIDVIETMKYIFDEIDPDDYEKVKFLFLPYDHKNLINFCLQKKLIWHPLSLYKRETLVRCLNESSSEIPSYLYEFYDDFLKGKLETEEYKLYHTLTTRYYDFVIPKMNGVLYEWISFTRDLNNILVGLNSRNHGFSTDFHFVGDNNVTSKLKMIAHRWNSLNIQVGANVINDKISELTKKIKFSKEFNV
ncbi:MAG: DUF2764 family protein [Saprospiraceae bacterium]|nr:DUF2764 family protein [Saprospiraceae bacterium]